MHAGGTGDLYGARAHYRDRCIPWCAEADSSRAVLAWGSKRDRPGELPSFFSPSLFDGATARPAGPRLLAVWARRRSTCRRRTSRGPREEIRTRSRDAAERATGTTTFPGDVVMAFREYGALLRVWTRAGKVPRAGESTSRPLCFLGDFILGPGRLSGSIRFCA